MQQLFFFLFFLLGCASYATADTVTVAVCANMQFAFSAIKTAYETTSDHPIRTVIASSGALTTQIQHGAPYDVFVSADMAYPHHLYNRGFSATPPEIYAYGALVLWSCNETPLDPDLGTLANTDTLTMAIADPTLAPYGKQALMALQQVGIFSSLDKRLIRAKNIAQVNHYVLSQAVDIGITAKSVVLAPTCRDKGAWTPMNPALYTPIAQGILLLPAHSSSNTAAQSFYHFMLSNTARHILLQYGYTVP